MQKYNDDLPELLSPKVDVVFKLIFGDERYKDLTIKFISAVLGYKDGELEDITFTDTHMKRESIDDKLGILDVKAKLSNGSSIDLEMQARTFHGVRSRTSYYGSNMITEQMGINGVYSSIKPVISIIVADFDFISESKKCHTVFQMLEKDEHFRFNDLEEIHVLSLEKISSLEDERLLNWLKFINTESKEDFMQLAKSNPMLGKAVDVLSVVSADKANRMLYEARLKAWRDDMARLETAKEEGMEKILDYLKQGHSIEEAEKLLSRK